MPGPVPAWLATALLAVAAGALASCSDSTAPAPLPGLHVVEMPRTSANDTIGAELQGVLIAQLNDSAGRPLPGVEVGMVPIRPPGTPPDDFVLFLHTAADASEWWADQLELLTDAAGAVRVRVKLGSVAGEIPLVLYAETPKGLLVDTTIFVVTPGAPASIDLQPADSALYEGGSYKLRPRVLDRGGNERGERPTLATDSSAISLSTDDAVKGRQLGRALVVATLDGIADSAWVSVVPHGVLAAVRTVGTDRAVQLVTFELDGSELAILATRTIEQVGWAASGAQLAFVDKSESGYYYGGRIFLRDDQGMERPLLADYTDYETQTSPRFSFDEECVYFAGRSSNAAILRVHPDGTGLETVVAAPTSPNSRYYNPAPSPDGRYVAYSASFDPVTRILDLATGEVAEGPQGRQPRWIIATDSLVVSTDTGFVILRADGAAVRSVRTPLFNDSPFDRSPDGRWVAVSTDRSQWGPRTIDLVNLDSGMRLPLGFSEGMIWPAWKP